MQSLIKNYDRKSVLNGIEDLLWSKSVRDSIESSSGRAKVIGVAGNAENYEVTRWTLRDSTEKYESSIAQIDEPRPNKGLFVEAFLLNSFEFPDEPICFSIRCYGTHRAFSYGTSPDCFSYTTSGGLTFGWRELTTGDYLFFISTMKSGGSLTKMMSSLGWHNRPEDELPDFGYPDIL